MVSINQLFFIPILLLFRFIISLSWANFPVKGVSWTKEATQWHHALMRLKNEDVHNLVTNNVAFYDDFNKTLDSILIPRVPGTPGHEQVRQFIVSEMKSLDWIVEEDSFIERTPHGKKPFTNIVATLNPYACDRLVIACHYDSKYNREYTFLGATDSAVPCAMMIHVAKRLDSQLRWQKERNNDLTLQFIFFDGEEAFKHWSRTDSLYGSRHLASLWNRMKPFPNGLNDGSHCKRKDYASYIDRMDVMVLLDLIGTANPKFYSYFLDTYGLYSQLMQIERRLDNQNFLEAEPPQSETNYFESRPSFAFVEDDHVPFMNKGVPIVHLIPNPFPHVWHKEIDNRSSLHHPTINNLNKILLVFIAEYLHLASYFTNNQLM